MNAVGFSGVVYATCMRIRRARAASSHAAMRASDDSARCEIVEFCTVLGDSRNAMLDVCEWKISTGFWV
jgi:hypothetical protein